MTCFSKTDLRELDALWRSLEADHVWTGWSAAGDEPEEIILYRTRAHWRKFPLRKTEDGLTVFDDQDHPVANATSLAELKSEIEAIPGLKAPLK